MARSLLLFVLLTGRASDCLIKLVAYKQVMGGQDSAKWFRYCGVGEASAKKTLDAPGKPIQNRMAEEEGSANMKRTINKGVIDF